MEVRLQAAPYSGIKKDIQLSRTEKTIFEVWEEKDENIKMVEEKVLTFNVIIYNCLTVNIKTNSRERSEEAVRDDWFE